MTSIQCIIADDEPLARGILEKYILEHPLLTLKASCNNAFETQAALNIHPCDILFLDINMPETAGIFTTAYPEYAVEGFELNAADYLVKPFSFDRFMKAVNKSMSLLRISSPENAAISSPYLFFKVDKKLQKVSLSDIIYFEATGDYVKLFLRKEVMLLNDTLKNLKDQLPAKMFVRVHKSYIISMEHLQFVEGNYIRIGNTDIPIGATYKEDFFISLQEQHGKTFR